MSLPLDSVLLVGYGGPERPSDIMPFLRRVVAGRSVPDERLAAVAHHYEAVGGRSPYNEQTRDLAAGLEAWFDGKGRPLAVRVGMRNWDPLLEDTVRAMADEGLRHSAGVILAAHRSEVSWDRYLREVGEACARVAGAPEISFIEPWFQEPGFLDACARRLEEAAGTGREGWPEDLLLVFTAHSIPVPMAERSPYVQDVTASCEGVASRIRPARWRLAWQSRSTDGRSAWLEPDILDVLREESAAGTRRIMVQAIGFLSDHVEVLYDLDVEAAALARSLGLTLQRAGCVNAHPDFVAMLGRRVLALERG
ncbi:MAG: ferrochelatase [Candidatus Polarisedimenticolia bacterium]